MEELTKPNLLNTLGTMVSIISAIVSFIIFILNKTIRNQILKKREIEVYSSFLSSSTNTIEKIKKFTAVNGKTQSLSLDKLVDSLKEYYELIKSIEKKLINDGFQSITEELNNIENYIQDCSKKDNSSYRNNKDELNAIYFKVINIQNNIKAVLDKKIY